MESREELDCFLISWHTCRKICKVNKEYSKKDFTG